MAIMRADTKYGYIILLKLTPLLRIAMISVLYAILDVKKITAIKVNNELNKLVKYGMKFI
jgi:hypothetical protein